MNRKHLKTLAAIFDEPTRANIKWDDLVSLLRALGATVTTRGGSMHSFTIGEYDVVFHRPHPGHELPRALVRRVRTFLERTGRAPR